MLAETRRYGALALPVGLMVWTLAGCPERATTSGPVPSSSLPSPNASILPAPLRPPLETPDGQDAGVDGDSGADANRPPPSTLREDVPLEPDTHRLLDPRGMTLNARFRWHGLPGPPTGPEVNGEAIALARRKTERVLIIDLSPEGRLRVEIAGPAFPLPLGTELRARIDRYGHVLVWPDGLSYRVLQPGTVRALFEEGRADVGQLVLPDIKPARSINALGYDTNASTVTTSLGSAVLHQAPISGAPAGELLCRTLLELLSAKPSTPLCAPDLVPVRAEYHWSEGGQLTFEVTSMVRTATLDTERLRVPPRTPSFKADRLPRLPRATLLDTSDLETLRKRAMPIDARDGGVAPDELVATNNADTIRYLLVDGIPVVRVPARSERRLPGLRPGRYVLSWADFLGAHLEPPRQEQIPLRIEIGSTPDAGVNEP
jgi:hypothetical protein